LLFIEEIARALHTRAMQKASFFVALLAAALPTATALAGTTSTNLPTTLRDLAATPGARDLLVRVDEALNGLGYSEYRTTSQVWNDSRGDYRVDCSGYVNRMVEDAVPEAYDELRDARGVSWPKAKDYYWFFRSIPGDGKKGRWARPLRMADARPGDLLVWRYKSTSSSTSSGHVMVIASKPSLVSGTSNVYRVRVTDAARSGHTADSRSGGGSGVGAGEMLVKVESAGKPWQYAWSVTGSFHTDVYLTLGRPR
jgi:hypothetical protein